MNAVCTIEGRRLDTKATALPFIDDEEIMRRQRAAIGSERLRHAILTTLGIDPGPFNMPPPIKIIVRDSAGRERDIIDVRSPKGKVARIQAAVALHYNLSPIHMKSAQRGKRIARPRQIAMYLAAELTTFSLVNIGKMFGGRDHTTVLYAIRAVAERVDADPQIALDVATLREALEA